MTFTYDLSDVLKKKLKKYCHRDKVLYEACIKKMEEIVVNPEHYKPLRYNLKGERRVHVKGSFVLVFEVIGDVVMFYDLDHHDNIYTQKHSE